MYSSSEEEELPHVNVESRGCPLNYNISGSPEIVILDEELPSVEKSHGFDSAVTTVADQDVNGRSDSDNVPDKAQEGTRVKRNYKEAAKKKQASKACKLDQEMMKQKRERKKIQQRADKNQQKEVDKALKNAMKKTSKENRPSERLKQMVVILDSTLSENIEFMEEFGKGLNNMEVGYEISKDNEPGSVRWKRIMKERTLTDSVEVVENTVVVEENELVITMKAEGFIGLVHYSKQAIVGNPLPVGAVSLEGYVDKLCSDYPGMRITLAIEGIDAFMRGHKTRINRLFRQAVLDSVSSSNDVSSKRTQKRVPTENMFSDVSRVECEEAMVRLQLRNGCVTRVCKDGQQLALYILTLTKALCESHYQKDNPFSFYTENGQGPSKKELDSTGNKVSLIWKHQLMQFNNLSLNMAAAVVVAYPSPAHLLQTYEQCSDQREAENLLKDIVIRRGIGVTSSTRKLGPVLSKRIHTMLTSKDPDLLLS